MELPPVPQVPPRSSLVKQPKTEKSKGIWLLERSLLPLSRLSLILSSNNYDHVCENNPATNVPFGNNISGAVCDCLCGLVTKLASHYQSYDLLNDDFVAKN